MANPSKEDTDYYLFPSEVAMRRGVGVDVELLLWKLSQARRAEEHFYRKSRAFK